jgi:quercetin dioxygenase-like cupin family protein
MQITVRAHFAAPIPHAHDDFNEAIFVVRGHLLVAADDQPQEAAAGAFSNLTAPLPG